MCELMLLFYYYYIRLISAVTCVFFVIYIFVFVDMVFLR